MKKVVVELSRTVVERKQVVVEVPDDFGSDSHQPLHDLYEIVYEHDGWETDADAYPTELVHTVTEDEPATPPVYKFTDEKGWE